MFLEMQTVCRAEVFLTVHKVKCKCTDCGKGQLAQRRGKLSMLTPFCGCSRTEAEVYFVEENPMYTVNAVGRVTSPYSSMGRSHFLPCLYLISIKRRQLA